MWYPSVVSTINVLLCLGFQAFLWLCCYIHSSCSTLAGYDGLHTSNSLSDFEFSSQ
jgi:hypothetical protein